MKLSVEVSMYPLQDGYINKIDDFLALLNKVQTSQFKDVEIRTSNMSTRLFGEYEAVTKLLSDTMHASMQQHGKVVFVCKYLQGDARDLENYA